MLKVRPIAKKWPIKTVEERKTIRVLYKKQTVHFNPFVSVNLELISSINDAIFKFHNQKLPKKSKYTKDDVTDLHLNYEISHNDSYIYDRNKKDIDFGENPTFRLFQKDFNEATYLERIDPLGSKPQIRDILRYHLFFKSNNFFTSFFHHQENISKQRSSDRLRYRHVLKAIRLVNDNEINKNTTSFLTTFFSVLSKHKYSIEYDRTFVPISVYDPIYPSIVWTQPLSMNQNRYIIAKSNDYQLKDHIISEIVEEARSSIFRQILNTEDKRYTRINSKVKINNIRVNKSSVLKYIRNGDYKFINRTIDESNKEVTPTQSISMRIPKKWNMSKNLKVAIKEMKQRLIDNQDSLYEEFTKSEDYRKIEETEVEAVAKGIKLSKRFFLETKFYEELVKLYSEHDYVSNFRLCCERNLYSDVFYLIDELRRLSLVRENFTLKHQIGFYYFNGFLTLVVYSRSTFGKVESHPFNIDMSKVYNLNYSHGKFVCKKDVKDLLKFLNCYIFASSREFETIKDINVAKNLKRYRNKFGKIKSKSKKSDLEPKNNKI